VLTSLAYAARVLEGFHQVAQLGVEQRIDGGLVLGRNHLGALEQILVYGAGEIDGLGHDGRPVSALE